MNIKAYRMVEVLLDYVRCGRTRRALAQLDHVRAQLGKRRRPLPGWFRKGALVAWDPDREVGKRGRAGSRKRYVVVQVDELSDGTWDAKVAPVGENTPLISVGLDGYPPFPFTRLRDDWRAVPHWFKDGAVVEAVSDQRGEGRQYEVVAVHWDVRSRGFLVMLKLLGTLVDVRSRLVVCGFTGRGQFPWRRAAPRTT